MHGARKHAWRTKAKIVTTTTFPTDSSKLNKMHRQTGKDRVEAQRHSNSASIQSVCGSHSKTKQKRWLGNTKIIPPDLCPPISTLRKRMQFRINEPRPVSARVFPNLLAAAAFQLSIFQKKHKSSLDNRNKVENIHMNNELGYGTTQTSYGTISVGCRAGSRYVEG